MSWLVNDHYTAAAVAITTTTVGVSLWLAARVYVSSPAIALDVAHDKKYEIDDFQEHWDNAHGIPLDVLAYERRKWWTHAVLITLALVGLALDSMRLVPAGFNGSRSPELNLVSASAALRVVTLCVVMAKSVSEQARMLALTLLQLVYLTSHLLTFLYDYKLHQESRFYATSTDQFFNPLTAFFAFGVAVMSKTGPAVQLGTMGRLGPRRVQSSMMGGGSVCEFLFGFVSFPVVKAALLRGRVDQESVPGLDAQFRSALIAQRIIETYRAALVRSQHRYPSGTRSDTRKALTLLTTMLSANSSLLVQQLAIIVITTFSFYAPKLGLSLVLDAMDSYAEHLDKTGAADTVSGRARATLLYSTVLYLVIFWEAFIIFACFNDVFVSFKSLFQVQLTSLLAWKRLRQREASGTASPDSKPSADGVPHQAEAAATASSSPSSSSQVLNLVTTDIYRISNKTEMLSFGIMGPLEIFVGGYSAYLLLGKGALLGLATAALMQPVAIYMGSWTKKIDETLQKSRDRRVMLLSETIKAMRMVKYQAWEDEMADKILDARNAELRCQAKSWGIYTFFASFFALTPVLVIVVSFAYYTLVDGHTLTAAVAFPAVAVLVELRFAVSYLPNVFLTYIQAWVSLKRIAVYLETGDVDLPTDAPRSPSRSISISNAQLTWPTESISPGLQEPTQHSSLLDHASTRFILSVKDEVHFDVGKLNLVCGKIGSGKTLLLLSLLGETELLSGNLSCPRSHPTSTLLASKVTTRAEWIDFDLTAYAPQRPFLFNASIRDNVLFGLEYDQRRYADVVYACGLRPDLRSLKDADRTEIGEGGTNLSGGQKARVSLARAVYSRAGTILIDDCLSALDSHTTKHVCEHLFDNEAVDASKSRRRPALLKGRTVILVTHHVRLMAPRASKVLMLIDGRVGFVGDSDAFVQSKHFDGLQKEQQEEDDLPDRPVHDSAVSSDAEDDGIAEPIAAADASALKPTLPSASGFSQRSVRNRRASSSAFSHITNLSVDEDGETGADDLHRLVSEEKRAVGRVSYAVYAGYMRAGGGYLLWSLIVLGFCGNAFSDLLANWWLRLWSSASTEAGEPHSTEWWLYRWIAIQAFQVASITVGTALVCVASLLAGSRLFRRLLHTVLRAPLGFHDSIPSGRLLNRFGKDMESIDSSLGQEFVDAAKGLLLAVAALIATWLGGGFAVLIILFVMAPLFYMITVTFTIAARDLKRLDSTTSSHRISAFTDLITGVVTIRAFGASSAYMSTLIERLDENLIFYFWQGMVRQWQTLLFSMASSGFVISTLMVVTLTPGFTAARAGFTLSFVQSLISTLQYGMRSATNVEQSLVSVERILEYLDIETEPLDAVPGAEPLPADWPQKGAIEINNLCLRYAPSLPDVLNNVSLTVRPGEKVGIVGSTGSGKSTLVSALFRFFEYHSGSITVDGVDIGHVGLKDLRSRMQIVPQDPLILSGTLRSAVDPLGHYSDDEISSVLRTVGLLASPSVEGYGTFDANTQDDESGTLSSLEAPIQESGANLSSGQKQLVSLTRILLSSASSNSPYSSRAGSIIVLDESTSSIDYQTDLKIQTLLAAHFRRHATTVLAIAHRLRSIIDYDTVIVLDKGRIIEKGNPKQLLQKQNGAFQRLAKDTGPQEYEALCRLVGL